MSKHRTVRVIDPIDKRGWVTIVIDGHWVSAKVSLAPSRNGINGGKVFKLCIAAGERFGGLDHAIYNFSRGLDFDKTPSGLLERILAYLETL